MTNRGNSHPNSNIHMKLRNLTYSGKSVERLLSNGIVALGRDEIGYGYSKPNSSKGYLSRISLVGIIFLFLIHYSNHYCGKIIFV